LSVRVFLLQFLVRLVSSYRYAGEHVDDELARAEAAELHGAVAFKKEALHGDVVRIVSSRSKPQLKATFERYKQEHGKAIDEVLYLSPSHAFCRFCCTMHTIEMLTLF
jgi:cupin superfamily acireductone dioxygenase involved in methionine salvage